MKNVAHTHIHATQAQYAKSALKKLRLASLAPWVVAALSLGSNVAQALTPLTSAPIKVQLNADVAVATCTIATGMTASFHMSPAAKVPTTKTFTEWVTDKGLTGSINSVSLGTWRGGTGNTGSVSVECTNVNQKIASFHIVNKNPELGLGAGEAYLKDTGNDKAFTDGKVAAFLISRTEGAGPILVNHGFQGTNPAYTNGNSGIPLSPTPTNGKYSATFTWTPIFTATDTNLLIPNPSTYLGNGEFFAELQINISY